MIGKGVGKLSTVVDFTVIVVTHNRMSFFKNAIQSVISQTYTNFECLVFNDYPLTNHDVAKVLTEFNDGRIRFHEGEERKGANYWRNFGIRIANGEYIAFLDDDDVWAPKKLELHKLAHRKAGAILVYSDYILTWPGTGKENRISYNPLPEGDLVDNIRLGKFSLTTSSAVTLRRRSLPKSESLFDESLPSFQDWDAWFRLVLDNVKNSVHRVDTPLIYFTQHGGERTSTNIEKRKQALCLIKKKYEPLDINITGFLNKEYLNVFLAQLVSSDTSKVVGIAKTITFILLHPRMWFYRYTYRKLARHFVKNMTT